MTDREKKSPENSSSSMESQGDIATDSIASRLRDLYSDIESEGIPDNLVHLLDKLDQAEKSNSENKE